jgi:O-acetyl-ADP-ribose deacetylase (regulator of RNase III)
MIRYVTGDATRPEGAGLRVICHVCNDVGAWGSGFVVALSRRWPEPELLYREHSSLELGEVMFATVDNELLVANMVAQHAFPTHARPVAVDYEALRTCLSVVAQFCASEEDASVHMPRIGCGIAGGDWTEVARIIGETLIAGGVPVNVYDLPSAEAR